MKSFKLLKFLWLFTSRPFTFSTPLFNVFGHAYPILFSGLLFIFFTQTLLFLLQKNHGHGFKILGKNSFFLPCFLCFFLLKLHMLSTFIVWFLLLQALADHHDPLPLTITHPSNPPPQA